MVDFIHPVRFPFYAARRPRDHSLSFQSIIAFDLFAEVDDVEQEVAPFFTQNPRLLPAGCSLDTGLYLCKYCGYAVKEGEVCPGCGGERVPLMELIDLDRVCRYCGSTMRGGIVCPDCGARIAGTALKHLWRDK
jgi:RNA polymerase subunit RPABC4/transcription elongation factor Spt4